MDGTPVADLFRPDECGPRYTSHRTRNVSYEPACNVNGGQHENIPSEVARTAVRDSIEGKESVENLDGGADVRAGVS